MDHPGKKGRKLPDRYPREQATAIFGDMSELDHVLELLSQLGERLAAVPDNISGMEWDEQTATPLIYLAEQLRKAYIEYERFWQPAEWAPESDSQFMQTMHDYHEMSRRLKEIEEGYKREKNGKIFRAYDPALEACAKALYFTLLLRQMPGDRSWVEYCVKSMCYELTRYHAASLEILLGRSAVFVPGRAKGAVSKLHKYLKKLYSLQHPAIDFESFWTVIAAECHTKTVNGYFSLRFDEVDEETLYYTESHKEKPIKKSTIKNKFYSFYKK